MTDVGYIRVSTVDQNTDRQLEGVTVGKTFTDKASGGSKDRPALDALLEYVREGDTVHVHSIDRLARDLGDLLSLLQTVTGRGVSVVFHKERLTFTGEDNNPFQTLQLQVIGAVARFERAIIKERQREGIAKAKTRGVYRGRKPSIDVTQVKAMHQDRGLSPSAIAKELGIARSSVYRVLGETAQG
jgi:DNA invertase Pin-like site-specific DNA recombinase